MYNKKSFPKGALYVIEVIRNSGHKAYFVGGCVRDLMLGKSPHEFDVTTDATPHVIKRLFDKVVPTGEEFGTMTVVLADGSYEVTTFRSDESYSDARHPDRVTFTKSIGDDLSRRDFTVNAMAYDPFSEEFIDKHGGRADLKKKIIRTVGDPLERFGEDGLRPVRACRFAAKLDFKIENKTLEAIRKTLDVVRKVSPERIHDEMVKMLSAEKPSIGIEYMRISGLLKLIIPELDECFGVTQPKPFHKHDVYWHSLYTCDALAGRSYQLRLAGLLHDIAKPECKVERPTEKGMTFYNHDSRGVEIARDVMTRLKFSNADIDSVTNLIRNHMFNYQSEWSDSAVRRFMIRVGVDNLDGLFELRVADLKAMEREVTQENLEELKGRISRVIDEDNALNVKSLKVDGSDVMDILKISPGPQVGQVLNWLLDQVIEDPRLNERHRLINLIKSYKG